jgi:hypothetical protein
MRVSNKLKRVPSVIHNHNSGGGVKKSLKFERYHPLFIDTRKIKIYEIKKTKKKKSSNSVERKVKRNKD